MSLNLFTQQPMFWAALAYAGGIVVAAQAWRPMSWWTVAALALLGFSAYLLKSRARAAAILTIAGFFCLGALHFELSSATRTASSDVSPFTDGNEAVIIGHVVRTGLPRARATDAETTERREVVDVETEAVEGVWGRRELAFGVRVTVRSQSAAGQAVAPVASFVYGERIRFPAKLREPRNYGNPGAMDYRGYLRGKGISALASVNVEKFEPLEGSRGSRGGALRNRWRMAVAEAMLSATSPEAPAWLALSQEDKALLLAMVIGEQSLLERTTRSQFQKTGVFHVLVVSGMNVGILAAFTFWVARRLRARPWMATGITIVLCLAYVAITDLGTPVLRAAIMLCLYLIARLLYRDRFSLNAVGAAGWLLLLFAPDAIFEPSFQLTFLSMVALTGIVQPLLEATSRPCEQALRRLELTGYDLTLEPRLAQFRIDLRLIAEKLTRIVGAWSQPGISWLLTRGLRASLALYDLVAVSVVMQLALALPMTIYFHRLALLGVPSNILIMPVTAVLLPAALIATLLQFISAALASVAWKLTALCLHAVTLVVQSASAVRFAEVRLAMPETAVAMKAAVLLALAVLLARRSRLGAVAAVGALLVGALLVTLAPSPQIRPGVMEVTTIDVGQGDSILVITPDGKTLLVDAGGSAGPFRTDNFDLGEDVVSPYLWSRGITRLDAVAVSHAHSDHLFGMPAIIANFRPRELWLGAGASAEGYERLQSVAQEYAVGVKYLGTGDRLALGAIRLGVLNPPRGMVPGTRRNEDSLVLQARYGETAVLLTGDAEKKTEEKLADSAERAVLLKVAHHGSGTSTTPELLRKTQPQYAVISAGYRNLYGHPRADVLARLRAAQVRTFRTDVQGAVTFYLDGKNIAVGAVENLR